MKDESKWVNILFNFIGFIGALVIAVVYIIWGYIDLKESGKTIAEIIGEGIFVFMLSFSLNTLLRLQGIILGKNNKKYMQTSDYYASMIDKCSPLLPFSDEFILQENEEAYKTVRTRILFKKGIIYKDHFDKDGKFLDNFYVAKETDSYETIKRIKEKNETLKRAINAQVTILQFNDLTSDETKENDPNDLGEKESEYMRNKTIWSLVMSSAFAVVFGYYTYDLVENFTKADLIYRLMQLGMSLAPALIYMILAFLFVINKLRGRMINKINKLDKFYNKYKDKLIPEVKIGFVEPIKEEHNPKEWSDSNEPNNI